MASNNERLLFAAKNDNEDLILEIFGKPGSFNINYIDGLGNTALHYAASKGSIYVLEHILSHEDCDVDPINRLEKATPLHLAVKISDPELRFHVVESLLEAGADTKIKDKWGTIAIDLVPANDERTRGAFRLAQVANQISYLM
ncbi:ankyrin repeat-containing domain protein [Cantharellus anzutake]|uniref:ankyrin repeat-containing domain protein n=1 Tax=Cantharellus anzutake TaxID=1750568 RepID=UPI0019088A21|nr:ankyrin repeat-containing domain protein [Cantharellus anzutake]KAF8336455.1 ankyrin repeat-containing domain protein [Cantharellus anzutake]